MAQIISIPDEQRTVPVPKAPEEARLYNDALAMMSAGVAFGKLKALVTAGALYNIHEKALWRLEGVKTFAEWLQGFGMSERSERRYRQIAESMKALIAERTGKELVSDFVFNAKVIKEHFGEEIRKDLNVHKLAEHSRDLQQFENYLSGADIPTAEAVKLLHAAPKKDTSSEARPLPAYTSAYMQKFAEENGLIWNGHAWMNPDGSPLTDAQRAMLTSYEDGCKVWEDIERAAGEFMKTIIGAIERDGSAYERYNSKKNVKFSEQVRAHNIKISTALERVEQTVHALCVDGVQAAVGTFHSDIQL